MKYTRSSFRRFAAVVIGIVFMISGLLKLADPVGTMLVVQEYLKFFHITFLMDASKFFGIALSFTETVTGLALLTGVFREFFAAITFLMLGFFTIITLILWFANPNMDCGCFGAAAQLSHSQSFLKNIVLLLLSVAAFLPFKEFGQARKRRSVAAFLGFLAICYAVWYSNTHVPIVDFTEFNFGSELQASLEDELARDNHYRTVYIYEKDGQSGTFHQENLPDSTWTFVREEVIFQEGAITVEKYPQLSFRSQEGDYPERMAAEGPVVVFSVYEPEKADWARLEEQYRQVEQTGVLPLLLVSANPDDVDQLGIPVGLVPYFADFRTLITLNRFNGGGTYFYEGELIDKWSPGYFPKDLEKEFTKDPLDLSTSKIMKRRIGAQGFILYLAALLILL